MNELCIAARNAGCEVALFGHTHKQFSDEIDGILLVNPGAANYGGGKYAVLNVEHHKIWVDLFEKS